MHCSWLRRHELPWLERTLEVDKHVLTFYMSVRHRLPYCLHSLTFLVKSSTKPDQLFLIARILFLCTASRSRSSSFIRSLVEERHHGSSIIEIIGAKLDSLLPSVQQNQHMAPAAMTDLLKFVFNILAHYPKVSLFSCVYVALTDVQTQLVHNNNAGNTDDGTEDLGHITEGNWSPELDKCVLMVYCTHLWIWTDVKTSEFCLHFSASSTHCHILSSHRSHRRSPMLSMP